MGKGRRDNRQCHEGPWAVLTRQDAQPESGQTGHHERDMGNVALWQTQHESDGAQAQECFEEGSPPVLIRGGLLRSRCFANAREKTKPDSKKRSPRRRVCKSEASPVRLAPSRVSTMPARRRRIDSHACLALVVANVS